MRDERAVAGELEEATDRELGSRRASQRRLLDAGERGDRGGERDARVDERLERVLELERADPLRADLADPRAPGREARRLEVDDDEVRVLELHVPPGGSASPTEAPRQASRASPATTSSRSERASAVGRAREREETAGRLRRLDRPAPRLDELHEPVGGVERELHGHFIVDEHTFGYDKVPLRRERREAGFGGLTPRAEALSGEPGSARR